VKLHEIMITLKNKTIFLLARF